MYKPFLKFYLWEQKALIPLSLRLLRGSVTVVQGEEGGNVLPCDHKIEFILCINVLSVIFFTQKRKLKK